MEKLPVSCGNCELRIKRVLSDYGTCSMTGANVSQYGYRPDNCPLIETIKEEKQND